MYTKYYRTSQNRRQVFTCIASTTSRKYMITKKHTCILIGYYNKNPLLGTQHTSIKNTKGQNVNLIYKAY